jgi:hypothetical protein
MRRRKSLALLTRNGKMVVGVAAFGVDPGRSIRRPHPCEKQEIHDPESGGDKTGYDARQTGA